MRGKTRWKFWAAVLLLFVLTALTSCGLRLLSKKEVEERLAEDYGGSFTVLSAENVPGDNKAYNVWRARAYTVVEDSNPDQSFFAYCTVRGNTDGVPGWNRGFWSTYEIGPILEIFEKYGQAEGLDYTLGYGGSPFAQSDTYHSRLNVMFGEVTEETLESICRALAETFRETAEKYPAFKGGTTGVTFFLSFRRDFWPEGKTCSMEFSPFYIIYWDKESEDFQWQTLDDGISAETLRDQVLAQADRYAHNLKFLEE